ncbi:MAG: site-specific DNA-methyltransferase, partial [Nitrospinota bacterium]
NKIKAVPVQRNKGIDGFLQINGTMVPVPVKVQRSSETLDEAIQLLISACKKNKYQKKILIKTNSQERQLLFEIQSENNDKDLIISDGVEYLSHT